MRSDDISPGSHGHGYSGPRAPARGHDERLARARLTYLCEPGDERLNSLASTLGAADTLAAISQGRYPGSVHAADRDAATRALRGWRERLGELPGWTELNRLYHEEGIRLICPGDAEWPGQLDDLGTARPLALWLRGSTDLRAACSASVTVTGSRAATGYGTTMASILAAGLARENGWTIVSGAGYGVDAGAHSGALAAESVTVAIMAGGVNVPYPAGHRELLERIAARGAVVSEMPPGRNVSRIRFIRRSRILAAVSDGTVIVEAVDRSPAMQVARQARGLGRPLMALPGPVTSAQSAGCHALIRNRGATLITDAGDITAALTAVDRAPSSGRQPRTAGFAAEL